MVWICVPRVPCIKGLVPSPGCYWEVVEPLRGGTYQKVFWVSWAWSWRGILGPQSSFFHSLCLPTAMRWVALLYHAVHTMMLCLTTGPQAMGPSNHDWNLWNYEPKETFPPYKLIISESWLNHLSIQINRLIYSWGQSSQDPITSQRSHLLRPHNGD
jgi:hypothetical protein